MTTKAIRLALVERDGAICHYCGVALVEPRGGFTENGITIDHVNPSAKGGGHNLVNMVLSCPRCNSSKGAKHYQEFVMPLDTDRTLLFLMGSANE